MSQQPESHPINIFEVLPNELIREILSHVNSLELIFLYSRVCKYWRSTCQNLIWQDYEKTLLKFKLIPNDNPVTTTRDEHLLDTFFTESPYGQKFIKYLLRKQVFELSCKLSKIETQPVDHKDIRVDAQWVDTELAILKGYFNNFADLSTVLPKSTIQQPTSTTDTQQQQKGFFASALSFIGSMFSTNPNSSPQQEVVLSSEQKRSETTRVKLQLWDNSGKEKYRSIIFALYRGASVVMFVVDPYCDSSCFDLDRKRDEILKHSPKAEVIFITTKKDQEQQQKRIITNDEADVFAFENFGGIHLDITNTKVEEPKSIVWYSALMTYLLNAHDC